MLRFYSLPELFHIQLVHGVNVEHHFPRHIHSSFLLGMIEQGERLFEIQGELCLVKAGECFIIHPYEPHLCKDTGAGGHDYWTLSIQAERMQQFFEDIHDPQTAFPIFSKHRIRDASLLQAMRRFVATVENDEELFLQELVFRELIRLCATLDIEEQEPLQQSSPYAVGKVREYLEQHFEKNIRLEELSEIGRISPFYLTRLFQQQIGVPPYEYLVKIRLKHAQRFLEEGESIAGAAYRSGFSDQSHLTRFFKRHMGLTPGQFVQCRM